MTNIIAPKTANHLEPPLDITRPFMDDNRSSIWATRGSRGSPPARDSYAAYAIATSRAGGRVLRRPGEGAVAPRGCRLLPGRLTPVWSPRRGVRKKSRAEA